MIEPQHTSVRPEGEPNDDTLSPTSEKAQPDIPSPSSAELPPLPPSGLPTEESFPVPHRRPLPPKKGILKPPRQAPKSVFGSFRPRELVGGLGKLLGQDVEPRPPPTARERERDRLAAQQAAASPGGQAGAFLSRAFGKLSAVAAVASGEGGGGQGNARSPPISASSYSNANNLPISPQSYGPPLPPPQPAIPPAATPLKRAAFVLHSISVTYPISSSQAPYSPSVSQSIEEIESQQRKKLLDEGGWTWWTGQRLVELYERGCKFREERPILRVKELLQIATENAPPAARVLDLSGVFLSRFAAEALADVLTVEWGMTKLVLDDCDLADDSLKPILHALLVSGTLPTLSLVNNRRIKATGWRLLAAFLKKAKSLRFLDISDNTLDRKSIDFLVSALTSPLPDSASTSLIMTSPMVSVDEVSSTRTPIMPQAPLLREAQASSHSSMGETASLSGLATLRMDGCGLRGAALEALSQGVRTSEIKNISLRRNRVNAPGGVALALLVKDYPEVASTGASNPFSQSSVASSTLTSPSATSPSSPYTAYTPRSRRANIETINAASTELPSIPQLTTNGGGGITSRTVPSGYVGKGEGEEDSDEDDDDAYLRSRRDPLKGDGDGPGVAESLQNSLMQSRVRSLDDVERIGKLVTLDLKGNDLRSGVTYIAQVLKRNRTLKVLNLSDNKIDVQGLVALAEALKYNSTLDTLDLSMNPCSGPGLEGITTLRTSFTLNANLKRLFLCNTSLTTEGAIALAEFLPEARHLLHLDLTDNRAIEIAGIMALAVGLRKNTLIRCLDLSIMFNNEQLSGLSQDILQSCIRNTELAQAKSTSKAAHSAMWAPIQKSQLARDAKEADEARAVASASSAANTPAGIARSAVFELSNADVLAQTEDAILSLAESCEIQRELGVVMEEMPALVEKGKALRERLGAIVGTTENEDRLQVLLGLVDRLSTQLEEADKAAPRPAATRRLTGETPTIITTPTRSRSSSAASQLSRLQTSDGFHLSRPDASTDGVTSPSFSLGDSDSDDSDNDDDASSRAESDLTSPSFRTTALPPAATPSADDVSEAADESALGSPSSEDGQPVEDNPIDQKSTNWIEEEGEVFRKGVALMAADVDEEDGEEVTGEQLKKELLEAQVERPRRLSSELNADELEAPVQSV